MNSIVNLKDGFITFNSNIDHSLSFSKCAIGYSNYSINSHERGALVFLTNNNANTANVSMHSDIRMCIASDGNIGIGTNNPSQKLDIAGNTNISRILKIGGINQNDDEIKLQVYASSNNIIAIFKHPNDSQGIGITYDSVFALGSDTNATQPISIKSKGNTNVVLNTNSIDRLTVFGNGNVGIGTNNANSRLHLHNTTANSDVGIRFSDFTSGAGATQGFAIGENSTQQAYLLNYGNTDMLFSTNNVERLRILANGNVGIGTTIPETALDVNGNLLIRAYGTSGSGTRGIFFRQGDFVTTNLYNCSILTFDHGGGGTTDGLSFNGYDGLSFCTGANSRQERMRITDTGNVGIGTNNPVYRTHIKCVYDDISKGLHLDASDDVPSAPNQYALTIYPYIVGAGQVGWKFRSQSQIGGTQTPLTFNHAGNVILGGTISGNGSLLTSINAANISSGTIDSLRLPTATTSVLGGVKVDGTTITINSSTGVISGANTYVLPTASTSVLGGVKVDGTIHTIINDTLKIIEPTSKQIVEDSVIREYPSIRNFATPSPTGYSGKPFTVSNQLYGNGIYTIYYTSMASNGYYTANGLWWDNGNEARWADGNYTASTGLYNKTLSIVGDSSYLGDGVSINFPVSIKITSYTLKHYGSTTVGAAKDIRIYGSKDSINWDILDTKTNITYTSGFYTGTITTTEYYNHYALSVNRLYGSVNSLSMLEWHIYGKENLGGYYYKNNSVIKYVAGNQSDISLRNTGSWQIVDDFSIPIATSSILGGVKKGNNINIAGDGTISVDLLSYNGNSTINGDLVVNSNLIVHGTSTTLNTDVYTTERLEITNSGTINPTLTIKQTASGNTNNILNVINSATSNVFNVSSTGNTGIGTTNPINRLHLHNTTANSDVSIRFTDTTSGAGATEGFVIGENTTQQAYLWNYGNTDMLFATNNAERLRILANGNVGIGTNSSLSSLHLHKNAITQDVRIILSDNTSTSAVNRGFQFGKDTLNRCFIWNFENTAMNFATNATERMTISNTGNVGIGTNADIQSKLTINGINTNVANSFDHSEAPLTITNPTATSTSVLNDPKAVLNLCRTGTTGQAYSTRACFKLCRYENDSVNSRTRLDITLAHNYYDELNIMSLQSGGNVGIGITNPVSRLHLHNTTANSDVAIRFTDSTSGSGATNGFVIGENSTQKAYLWNYGNTDMLFATNNAERMTISNAGNVGIGTISPNANLHLHGNAASQNVRISFSDNTSGIATTDGFCIGKDSLQKAYIYNCENADIDFGTSNTERMRIMANGNIGIGTNSSLSSLHLHKNALAQDVRIILSDNTSTSSTTRGLHLIKGTDNIGYLWNYENTPLILATNNAERMRIAENGNVGIGTTPALHFFHLHMNNTTDVLRLCFTNNNTTTAINRGLVMGIHSNRDTFLWNNENTSLVFGTNNIGRIIILANGNVGIGTDTGIGEKLVVSGNAQITGTISGNGSLLTSINAANISSGTIDSLRLPIAGSGAGGILGGVKVDGTTITINASGIITSVGGGGSAQWTTSGINIYNANTGNIGIGTNDPAIYKCQVNGNLGATGNITAYYSDERLKNITEYVSDVLPALDKINVFKYNCNDLAESFGYDKSKKEIGLSAQEIQKFYPEIVSIAPFDADLDKETKQIISKSGENYLTLDYERLVPVLLQAIKELNRKYTALEDKYNKIMPT
jgi:phage FluMu protein gp41